MGYVNRDDIGAGINTLTGSQPLILERDSKVTTNQASGVIE
jgi:hypothetical protein